jgi:hypothetical protein
MNSEKTATQKIEQEPTAIIVAAARDEIPPGLGGLAHLHQLRIHNPKQFVIKLFPKLEKATDEEVDQFIEAFTGIFSGIPGFNLGVQVPDWVVQSSKKYFEGLGLDFAKINADDIMENGKLLGLMETVLVGESLPELKEAATDFVPYVKAEAAKASPKDAVKFFTGVESAEKTTAKMKQPTQRAIVFLMIAAAWREVEKFNSAGELHRWLDEKGVFLSNKTEPAETRKICRLIGLQLRNKTGRPSKTK